MTPRFRDDAPRPTFPELEARQRRAVPLHHDPTRVKVRRFSEMLQRVTGTRVHRTRARPGVWHLWDFESGLLQTFGGHTARFRSWMAYRRLRRFIRNNRKADS